MGNSYLCTRPLITNEEHQKLSKRSGHSSYEDLLEQGFLTEAIVNYVALLGWCLLRIIRKSFHWKN